MPFVPGKSERYCVPPDTQLSYAEGNGDGIVPERVHLEHGAGQAVRRQGRTKARV